jgi:hypothetical protein
VTCGTGGAAAGVDVGEGVRTKGGAGDAVGSASGEDDGGSLGAAAGPQAVTESRIRATRRVLTERSLPTKWSRGPDFAVASVKRYEFHGGVSMPPRGVKSAKRKRQYEHIKRSASARGRSNKVAERIAAATTNKTRRKKGETKGSRKKSATRRKRS